MFEDERLQEIADLTEGMALDAVWLCVQQDYGRFRRGKRSILVAIGNVFIERNN